jgi:ornithine cyclodeaminase
MSVFDLAWGYDLYQTAQTKGLGTPLLLWDSPHVD